MARKGIRLNQILGRSDVEVVPVSENHMLDMKAPFQGGLYDVADIQLPASSLDS